MFFSTNTAVILIDTIRGAPLTNESRSWLDEPSVAQNRGWKSIHQMGGGTMRELKLCFESGQLTEVEFRDPFNEVTRRSIRGKCSGAFRFAGSFQWTSAVRGLALLCVRACAGSEEPILVGGSGTLAASLDYAISKQPLWLTELFGCDQAGICLARRVFLRTNSERKRPGPTIVTINNSYLPTSAISIALSGHEGSREDLAELARALSGEETPRDLPLVLPRAA
jgi:hypothetical protein